MKKINPSHPLAFIANTKTNILATTSTLVTKILITGTLLLAPTLYASDFNFVALGDTGEGNQGQYDVSNSIEKTCDTLKCQFALMLGDNFYDVGVKSPNDPQFVTKFEAPYANLNLPFYITLGNHDYGKYANDWKRGDHQVEYAKQNPKWILPSHYYSFEHEDALFLVLDTSRLFHNKDTKKQRKFIQDTLKNNTKKWVIVSAHHPYISNGKHGNAGSYDGVLISPYSGSVIKKIVEEDLCPYMDIYMSGHEHSLQTLPGTAKCAKPLFVVSGTGAKVDTKLNNKNPTHFQKAVLGYTTLQVKSDEIIVNQVNVEGQIEHSITVAK